jgi:hypothetical protein
MYKTFQKTLAKNNTYVLYITSIGIPILLMIIIEFIEHFGTDNEHLSLITVCNLAFFCFFVSGFLLGIVLERWEQEETYESIPDKV